MAALAGAFNNNVSNPSLLNTITLAGNISGSSQWIVNANVNIIGNGYTINMNNADRAFFITRGTVAISNLAIKNGNAAGALEGWAAGPGSAARATSPTQSWRTAPTTRMPRAVW